MQFAPLPLKRYAPIPLRTTPEARYWFSFRPVRSAPVGSGDGAVHSVHFSPAAPYDLAATAHSRVVLVNGRTGGVRRNIARFKGNAFSGHFRGDGKLLVAGADTGAVQVFDANSRAVLRTFSGHTGTRFTADNLRVASASDDKTVRVWDLPTQACLSKIGAPHSDYIRAQAACAEAPHLWLTGCYDNKVRLFDLRAPLSKPVLTLEHGEQVEDVCFLPGGASSAASMVASCGGSHTRVWDLLSGGGGGGGGSGGGTNSDVASSAAAQSLSSASSSPATRSPAPSNRAQPPHCLATLHAHGKAVMGICSDGTRNRLLSASLDCTVKVHELATFTMVHTLALHSEVMAIDVAPDGSFLAAGLANGIVELRRRVATGAPLPSSSSSSSAAAAAAVANESHSRGGNNNGAAAPGTAPDDGDNAVPDFAALASGRSDRSTLPANAAYRPGTKRFYMRGRSERPDAHDDVVISDAGIAKCGRPSRRRRERSYERRLRKFDYGGALDAALELRKTPVSVGVIEELAMRDGLRTALSNRNDARLVPVLQLLVKNVRNPRHARVLADVAQLLLDMYAGVIGQSAQVDALFVKLRKEVRQEIGLVDELQKLQSALELIAQR